MPIPLEVSIAHGLCWCGCGLFSPIAKHNSRLRSHVKGEPVRYIPAHVNIQRPIIETAQPFKIEGVYCRLIPLTDGLWAIVDESDYEWLMQWKWFAHYAPNTRGYYAWRGAKVNGKQITIHMHRVILGLEREDPRHGDHKNKCGIDNRRKNLRPADDDENAQNARTRKDNTSGCKNINWHKLQRAWQVAFQYKKTQKHVGYFKDFEKARAALIEAVQALHSEFTSFD